MAFCTQPQFLSDQCARCPGEETFFCGSNTCQTFFGKPEAVSLYDCFGDSTESETGRLNAERAAFAVMVVLYAGVLLLYGIAST